MNLSSSCSCCSTWNMSSRKEKLNSTLTYRSDFPIAAQLNFSGPCENISTIWQHLLAIAGYLNHLTKLYLTILASPALTVSGIPYHSLRYLFTIRCFRFFPKSGKSKLWTTKFNWAPTANLICKFIIWGPFIHAFPRPIEECFGCTYIGWPKCTAMRRTMHVYKQCGLNSNYKLSSHFDQFKLDFTFGLALTNENNCHLTIERIAFI